MILLLISRIDANGVQQLFNISQSLAPRAVLIQVLVMTVLSIFTIVMFNFLRPSHKAVYEPKVKYHSSHKKPPRISDSFCGWIPPLLHNHEAELFPTIGLDAVVFLRFLHLLRWLFTLISVIGCGALIPLDFLYSLSVRPPQYDLLSAMSIRDVQGVRLYAHIGATYIFTCLLILFIHHHWKGIYSLRKHWLRSAEYQRMSHARTLCITNIPPRRQSDAALFKIFQSMQLPYPVTSTRIGKHVGELPRLIEQHDEAVIQLEEVVAKYTNGGKPSSHRPTIIIGGFCGLGGTRVDAIKYYTSKVRRAEGAVQQYRAQLDPKRTENYGFATIATIPLAHAAARELKGEHPKGLTFKLAPNPRDIIWSNIGLSKPSKQFRRTTGFLLMMFFSALSLFPLFPIASLANLDALAASGYIPFLRTWSHSSPISYALVSGLAPPIIAAFFNYFLPRLMRWLSKYMGAPTHTNLARIVIARYFAFLIVSQLIIFTILGVIFHSALEIVEAVQRQGANFKTIIENLDKLPARVTRTYVDQSSFWLKWFPLQGFFAILNLSQLFNLVWLSVRARIHGRTPREIREYTKPPVFDYAIQYSSLLFMATVGLLFAPLAPLVTLAAAIVFWLCSWVYKYQLMYTYVTKVESGGRMWNVVANRLIFSAMFMQFMIILTIGLQDQFKSLQLVASIPPLVILLLFKFYLNRKFANNFQYHLPEHQEFSRAVARSQQSSTSYNLEDRYCHPALKAVLFTPMIHSHALPILRRHYEGKGNENEKILTRGVSKKSQNVKIKGVNNDPIVDGVVFNVVPKDSLEYDPEQYKHDEDNAYYDYDHGAMPSGSRSALELRQPSSRHGNETSSRGVRLYDPGLTVRPIGMLSGDHHESTNRMYDIQAMNLSPALSYQPFDVPSHDVQPSTYQQRHRTRRNDEFTHDGISPGDKSLPPVPPGS